MSGSDAQSKTKSENRQCEKNMLLELRSIDREGANKVIKGWERFLTSGSGQQRDVEFRTLKAYTLY